MEIKRIIKPSFCVIGKLGCASDGNGFVQKLWKEANEHVEEILPLARRDENGHLVAGYGAMSNIGMDFLPWEDNFSKGYYLAGLECADDAIAPDGWTKWIVPGYEYIAVEFKDMDCFKQGLQYLKENQLELVGAVHDYNDLLSNKSYMIFPIRKL